MNNVPTSAESTRTWEVIAHLSALSILLAVPFGSVLGPLVVWLIKRNDSPSVEAHARAALNFHLSWTLYALLAISITTALLFVLVGFLLIPVLIVGLPLTYGCALICAIIAAVKAGNGQWFEYPLTMRLVG